MIKKISATVCIFFSLVSFAQSGSASPYSYFGIGEARLKGTLENRSIGGLSIEQDSIHINLLNPANFASLRLTTFTIGGGYNATKLKTDTENAKAQRTTLDYIAVALPLGKFGVGFGLVPYSSVGYNIISLSSDGSANNNRLTGSGGLNKAFFAIGYTIIPNLVVGVDMQYNFGNIKNSNLEFITEVPVGTLEENESNLTGASFNLGLMYQKKINKDLNFFSSLSFSPRNTLVSRSSKTISTVQYNAAYNLTVIDAITDIENKTDLTIPEKISIGTGIGESKSWLIGAQFVYQNMEKLNNNFNSASNISYQSYTNYSLGGYYIPNYRIFSKYYEKITYRAGLKYSQTGAIINSKSINEMGLTLGFGLPSQSGAFSNFNIGIEFGKKGTTSHGLVQENYTTFSLSLSLNDKWFRKSKID